MASALASKLSAPARIQRVSRSRLVCKAASRPLWLPGSTPPSHLNGTLAGDFGFDPLNLGTDPKALLWYQQAELVHCRTSMAAVAGILIPGILTKAGALSVPEWFDAGRVSNETSGIPFGALLVVQFFMYGFVEGKRWMDIRKPGSQGEPGSFLGFESAFKGTAEVGYPGGVFDPLGLSNDAAAFKDYKLKEVKNGRLAMLALLGFAAQYGATGKGPLDNLAEHLADPWHKTFAENGYSVPFF